MVKLLLVLSALLLSSCVTAKQPVTPVLKQSEFNFGEGINFHKNNFNLREYTKRAYLCYQSTARTTMMNNPLSQQERYESCMRTGGYKLTALSNKELIKRNNSVEKYHAERTPSDDKFYDKINFRDDIFIFDINECRNKGSKIDKQRTPPIYSNNATTALFMQILTDIDNNNKNSQKQMRFGMRCMLKKDYILSKLPKEEISRRYRLLK